MAKGSVIPYRGKRGIVWRIKYLDAGGKQVMETVGAERDGISRKQAAEQLERRRVEVRDGLQAPQALGFTEAGRRWFDSELIRRNWKPGTASQYRHWLEDLSDYFKAAGVAALREPQLLAFRDWALSESSYSSPASVNSRLTVLRMVLAWAKKRGYRSDVPVLEYAKVRQHKGAPLKPEQVQALLRAFADEPARVAFLAFVTTGLRYSELRALRWRDVDLIENRLRVEDSKTETGERSVALGKVLAEELWQHRRRSAFQAGDELVFCHPQTGGRFRSDDFKQHLEAAFERAGIDWPAGFRRCHDLRVTCATNDAIAGMNPAKLQVKLGHSDFRVTQRYVNLAGVVFAEEAEALELRLLGVESSTGLTSPESTEQREVAWNSAESAPLD